MCQSRPRDEQAGSCGTSSCLDPLVYSGRVETPPSYTHTIHTTHTLHVRSAAVECEGEEDEEEAEGDLLLSGCAGLQQDLHRVVVTDFQRLSRNTTEESS